MRSAIATRIAEDLAREGKRSVRGQIRHDAAVEALKFALIAAWLLCAVYVWRSF